MSSSNQTILIISGGFHVPQHYDKLKTALEASNFEVHVPLHPSMNGARPPNSDLYTDSNNIRAYAEDLLKNGRQIIVLMHSYGGQVGTNALHGLGIKDRDSAGLKGGIEHLIYMTAAALPEGKSMMDMVKHHGHEDLMPLAFDIADDMSLVSRDPKTLLVGADSDVTEAELEQYLSLLGRWNATCMQQPLNTERAAWWQVPVTFIQTTKDMTIPSEYQKWLVEEMRTGGVEVQTTTLETGHCPNLTAPDKVSEIVGMVARGEKLSVENVGKNSGLSTSDVKSAILEVVKGRLELGPIYEPVTPLLLRWTKARAKRSK